jgi:uncharacterized protein
MSVVPRQIDRDTVGTIALGSTILGTGGGGDPYIGRLMAEQAIKECGQVQLVDPDQVPRDAFVFLVGMMGAPAVIMEKLPSGKEALRAIDALANRLGRKITHIACLEAGGINSMIPIAAAARTGLPLIDADGMGRAFPELQMLLPTLEGIRATPMALVDEKGNSLVIDAVDNRSAEAFARTATVQMGAGATMAFYPLNGDQVRTALVPRTYSMAYRIGSGLREARREHRDPVAEVARQIGGRTIFSGKVVDVLRRTVAGFQRGVAVFEGIGTWGGRSLVTDFQNEFLIARRDGKVVVSTPDLICLVDAQTAEPVTTETLRYGQRLSIVAAPCYSRWRSDEGLKIVGPQYFGYDNPYVPFDPQHEVR